MAPNGRRCATLQGLDLPPLGGDGFTGPAADEDAPDPRPGRSGRGRRLAAGRARQADRRGGGRGAAARAAAGNADDLRDRRAAVHRADDHDRHAARVDRAGAARYRAATAASDAAKSGAGTAGCGPWTTARSSASSGRATSPQSTRQVGDRRLTPTCSRVSTQRRQNERKFHLTGFRGATRARFLVELDDLRTALSRSPASRSSRADSTVDRGIVLGKAARARPGAAWRVEKPGLSLAADREGVSHVRRTKDPNPHETSSREPDGGGQATERRPRVAAPTIGVETTDGRDRPPRRRDRGALGADPGRDLRAAGAAARIRPARRLGPPRREVLRALAGVAHQPRPWRRPRVGAGRSRARAPPGFVRGDAQGRGLVLEGAGADPDRHTGDRCGFGRAGPRRYRGAHRDDRAGLPALWTEGGTREGSTHAGQPLPALLARRGRDVHSAGASRSGGGSGRAARARCRRRGAPPGEASP